jgi:hypothetical protein
MMLSPPFTRPLFTIHADRDCAQPDPVSGISASCAAPAAARPAGSRSSSFLEWFRSIRFFRIGQTTSKEAICSVIGSAHDMFDPKAMKGKDGKPIYPDMDRDTVLFGGTDPGTVLPDLHDFL